MSNYQMYNAKFPHHSYCHNIHGCSNIHQSFNSTVWLISITRCNVSLWCVQLTFTWLITCVFCTTTIWILFASTSFCFLANLIRHSKYSNSLEMINMISIGVKEIFPLIKWERIINLTITSTPTLLVSLFSSLVISSIIFLAKLKIIGKFFFGILIPKSKSWFVLHILFNSNKVVFSSLTTTFRKFITVVVPFKFFFQHFSSICLNPKQKEHLRPQLSILCPSLHLAHFDLVLAILGHKETTCFENQHC